MPSGMSSRRRGRSPKHLTRAHTAPSAMEKLGLKSDRCKRMAQFNAGLGYDSHRLAFEARTGLENRSRALLLGQPLGHKAKVAKIDYCISILGHRMAEGVGFEPTIRFPVYTLSKRAP